VSLEDIPAESSLTPTHLSLMPGSYVRMVTKDSGPGIDPSIVTRIIDSFFTTKSPGAGTGLGLAVVHGIVKSHGGAIEVESTPDQGTTFSVYFPAVEGMEFSEGDGDVSMPRGRESILLVDDEESLVNVVKKMLKTWGIVWIPEPAAGKRWNFSGRNLPKNHCLISS